MAEIINLEGVRFSRAFGKAANDIFVHGYSKDIQEAHEIMIKLCETFMEYTKALGDPQLAAEKLFDGRLKLDLNTWEWRDKT